MTTVYEASQAQPLVTDLRGAMRMLQLGKSTVLALADSDQLPRLRTGRRVRYAVSDIERLVERMRSGEQLLTRAKSKPVPAR
jgi:hypothetical protein